MRAAIAEITRYEAWKNQLPKQYAKRFHQPVFEVRVHEFSDTAAVIHQGLI